MSDFKTARDEAAQELFNDCPDAHGDLKYGFRRGADWAYHHALNCPEVQSFIKDAYRVRCEYKESVSFKQSEFCARHCSGGTHSELCAVIGMSPCVEKFDLAFAALNKLLQSLEGGE